MNAMEICIVITEKATKIMEFFISWSKSKTKKQSFAKEIQTRHTSHVNNI